MARPLARLAGRRLTTQQADLADSALSVLKSNERVGRSLISYQ
jgi:hypothetical protein